MQQRHYSTILYFIIAIIVVTFGMQVYWNYNNYQSSKQQLINEVQISLDNAIENYYTDLTKQEIFGVSFTNDESEIPSSKIDSILSSYDHKLLDRNNGDFAIQVKEADDLKTISIFTGESHSNTDTLYSRIDIDEATQQQLVRWNAISDSSDTDNPFLALTTRVLFAMSNTDFQLPEVDSLVATELSRKKIDVTYDLAYTDEKGRMQRTNKSLDLTHPLQTRSTSSYLTKNTHLQLTFTNATLTILRRNIVNLMLSLLFMAAVVSCLLYLLKVIKHQKQLAEIKNDLISNITHEFKTPIATIGAAVEGIQLFNVENDPEKNHRYAQISGEQVGKLNVMVEKLLETATLDSDSLKLNYEAENLVTLLHRATTKEAFVLSEKTITFSSSEAEIMHSIDVFHFENAVNNIIDNAIKYGGEKISVVLEKDKKTIFITMEDSGTSITKEQSSQLFEKFYRVPKGNTHDVKGFGIGLYYTRKIIEKHGGVIKLNTVPNTKFIIELPNG